MVASFAEYVCPHCGAPLRIRSFRLMSNRCAECGARHGEARCISFYSLAGVAVFVLFFAACVAAAAGVAWGAVHLFQLATGQPNGGTELGIWIWLHAVPSILGAVCVYFPRLSGYRENSAQTAAERRSLLANLWSKCLVKSGVLLFGFLAWPQPDLTSKFAAVVLWGVWLATVARPIIHRSARLYWVGWGAARTRTEHDPPASAA
jgi:hypothetical protein